MIYKFTKDDLFVAKKCKKCRKKMEPSIQNVNLDSKYMYFIGWNCHPCDWEEIKKLILKSDIEVKK